MSKEAAGLFGDNPFRKVIAEIGDTPKGQAWADGYIRAKRTPAERRAMGHSGNIEFGDGKNMKEKRAKERKAYDTVDKLNMRAGKAARGENLKEDEVLDEEGLITRDYKKKQEGKLRGPLRGLRYRGDDDRRATKVNLALYSRKKGGARKPGKDERAADDEVRQKAFDAHAHSRVYQAASSTLKPKSMTRDWEVSKVDTQNDSDVMAAKAAKYDKVRDGHKSELDRREAGRKRNGKYFSEEGMITPKSRKNAAAAAHSPMVRYFANSKKKAKLANVEKGLFNRHDGIPRKPKDQGTARTGKYFNQGSYFGEATGLKEGKVKSAMMDFHDRVANEHQSKVDMNKKLGGGSHKVIANYEHTPSGGLKMASRIVHNDGSHTDIFSRGENGKIDHSVSRGSKNDDMNEGLVQRIARRMTGTAGMIPKNPEKKAVVVDRLKDALKKDVMSDDQPGSAYKLARTSKTEKGRYPVASMKKRSDRAAKMRMDALEEPDLSGSKLSRSVAKLKHSVAKGDIELDNSMQKMSYSTRGLRDTTRQMKDTADAIRANSERQKAAPAEDWRKKAKRDSQKRYRERQKIIRAEKDNG